MNGLDRIQRISGVLRYLVLILTPVLLGAIALAVLMPDQTLVTLGDGQLNELRSSGAIGAGLMFALVAPTGLMLGLGIYWLHRLFGEYQQGHFFTEGNMRAYVWLVWLKTAAFAYGVLLPLLLASLSPAGSATDVAINIELGTLVELTVLLLIVHLLRAAQHLHDENKAFI